MAEVRESSLCRSLPQADLARVPSPHDTRTRNVRELMCGDVSDTVERVLRGPDLSLVSSSRILSVKSTLIFFMNTVLKPQVLIVSSHGLFPALSRQRLPVLLHGQIHHSHLRG